jgi:hypothetical protein
MAASTEELNRVSDLRNAARFGVDSFQVAYVHDEPPVIYHGFTELFGFRTPVEQRFPYLVIKFSQCGHDFQYIMEPILKEVKEKDFFSASRYAVLDEAEMEKEFKERNGTQITKDNKK